ncbi:tRNA pseudouridine(38-40) synthase TruA [Candidatus Poribacteria bacterium]|nr:MAG: tRNA pseudouridine(38-40) synthase TruA [Candidatus Poribacteria bacterium]
MPRNIKLVIEYDGTDFKGWQIQPGLRTVQGVIQDAIKQLTGEDVRLKAAGRTDSGVHAICQVANFFTESKMSTEEMHRALNAILPGDVAIISVEEVDEKFDARYSAISRRYRYTILNRNYPSAIMRNFVYFYPEPLDAELMNKAIKVLEGTHDFSSFRRSGDERSPTRTVIEAKCWREGDLVRVEIEAKSFLRGMVRAIVGTLLMLNKEKPEDPAARMKEILDARDRSAAGPSVPPHGLCLIKVRYPGEEE